MFLDKYCSNSEERKTEGNVTKIIMKYVPVSKESQADSDFAEYTM